MKERDQIEKWPMGNEPRDGELRFVPNRSGGGVVEIWRDSEWVAALVALDGEAPLAEWLVGIDPQARGDRSEPVNKRRRMVTLTGQLPTNTFGGALSEGRMEGFNHAVEGTLQ